MNHEKITYPFRLILRDAKGKILTQTRHIIDNDSTQVKLLPFNFIKRGSEKIAIVKREFYDSIIFFNAIIKNIIFKNAIIKKSFGSNAMFTSGGFFL